MFHEPFYHKIMNNKRGKAKLFPSGRDLFHQTPRFLRPDSPDTQKKDCMLPYSPFYSVYYSSSFLDSAMTFCAFITGTSSYLTIWKVYLPRPVVRARRAMA